MQLKVDKKIKNRKYLRQMEFYFSYAYWLAEVDFVTD